MIKNKIRVRVLVERDRVFALELHTDFDEV